MNSDAVTCVKYDSQGKRLVSCSIDKTIKIWDTEKGYRNTITLYDHQHTVSYANFLLGDSYVLSCSRDCTIKLWDTEKGCVKREYLGHQGWVRKIAISQDYINFVSCSGDQMVHVWVLEK